MALDWELMAGAKDRAAKAIKEGKTEEALKYVEELSEQGHGLHNLLIDWVSASYGKLAEFKGEEWLVDFTRKFISDETGALFEAWGKMTPQEALKGWLALYRACYHEFDVEEDDEKYIIKIHGCGNAGRLMKEGIAKSQNAVTTKPHPWSFNRVGFPYYCIHVNPFMELADKYGFKMKVSWGQQYDDKGNKINDPCVYHIYK
jgi:hypothetical protein